MRSSRFPRSIRLSDPAVCYSLLVFSFLLQSCNAVDLQPLVATTGTNFLGYDGNWSPISIRVGSPEQWLSVLPNTLSQETWVVGPAGCDGTSICESKRGGLFYSNQSSSFQSRGYYELGFDTQLGNTGFADYGLDSLALDDAVSESEQIIGVINSTEFWIGQVGLGVQQTRFNGTTDSLPLLSSLVQNKSVIPSHSYGYTAGAFYRLKGVPASLTLGGVDANRFTPNDMSFTLSAGYEPVVAVNSISVSTGDGALPSNWNSNPVSLLDSAEADVFTIDSSTPFLWLPEVVCNHFASALNLTYDTTLELYVFTDNATSPNDLTALDLTFTFSLSNSLGSTSNLELTLPYDAFNLQLSYPFPNLDANFTSTPTNYFPLRRASSSSQYTIGRAFLQETYLSVDYERNNFSLSQAVFTLDAVNNVNLLSITRPANSVFPGPSESLTSGLSTGTKVGIAVGALLLVLLVGSLLWLFCVHSKRRARSMSDEKHKSRRSIFSRLSNAPTSSGSVAELIGDKRHPTEVAADTSASRFELAGSTPIEMSAGDVPPTFYANREHATSSSDGLRNDPQSPSELEHQPRNSIVKDDNGFVMGSSDRSGSPVPPYSPGRTNQRFLQGQSISPYSPRHSQGFGNRTNSSGEQGISPVGNSPGGHSYGSQPVGSPISPEATTSPMSFRIPPRRQRLNYGEIYERGVSGSRDSNGKVPQTTVAMPATSPSSQSSSFVQQGINGCSVEPEAAAEPPARPKPVARFSWEA